MKALFFVLSLCMISFSAEAREQNFLTSCLTRSRALAMGSAYHSLVDDFSSGLFNPGAFKLNRTREERTFRIFFNPVGLATSFYDYSKYDRDFTKDDKLTFTETLLSLSMLFKGAVFTTQLFDMGINLGEEIIHDHDFIQPRRFFSIKGQTYDSFNSAFVNFKISS